MTETRKGPVYYGLTKYTDNKGGYGVWLPNDWHQFNMTGDHNGWVFSPYPDNTDTCFACEKNVLEIEVSPQDVDVLAEGFEAGILSLPDVEIEEKKYEKTKKGVILEAKFTFTENGQRRKRWVKSLYWGEANLVLFAQGSTVDEYEYWLPMLFNAMSSYELGIG
jgi:hypothetical protein